MDLKPPGDTTTVHLPLFSPCPLQPSRLASLCFLEHKHTSLFLLLGIQSTRSAAWNYLFFDLFAWLAPPYSGPGQKVLTTIFSERYSPISLSTAPLSRHILSHQLIYFQSQHFKHLIFFCSCVYLTLLSRMYAPEEQVPFLFTTM